MKVKIHFKHNREIVTIPGNNIKTANLAGPYCEDDAATG